MTKTTDPSNGSSLVSILKKEWYMLALILASLLVGLYLYPDLPARMPIHWNIRGEVDGWSSKTFAVYFFPLINLGIYLMLLLLPKIDPRRENYRRFSKAYTVIRLVLVVFFTFIYLLTLYAAFGHKVKVDIIVKFSVSLLFVILGNYMGKIKHNYFVGIRTPWTLANEEVWNKTHRYAAPLWVGAGVLGMILSFIRTPWSGCIFFAGIMAAALLPAIYSYLVFKKLKLSQ